MIKNTGLIVPNSFAVLIQDGDVSKEQIQDFNFCYKAFVEKYAKENGYTVYDADGIGGPENSVQKMLRRLMRPEHQ